MESVIFRLVNNITSILKQPLNDKDLEAMSDIAVLSEETVNILERSLPDFVNYLSSLSRENKPLSPLDMEFIKVAGKSVAVMLYTVNAVADEQKRVWLNDRQPRGFDVGFHSVEWLKAVAMFFPDVIKCDLNQILTYKVSEETPNNFNRYLPSEIDTEQARKYFARAVAAGLMSEQFEWLASQSLLACFCREMSVNLDLGKGYSSEGQRRLSWKPFEALFNVKAKNLTTSLNDIKKTGQDPIGIEKVEAIFKD